MFIDTHCHLDLAEFDADREKVIQRAIQNKINAMLTVGIDVKSSRASISLADKFAVIYATAGIHPNNCAEVTDSDFAQIEVLAKNERVVAIGEIGLDYFRTYAPKDKQIDVFRKQLQLARRIGKPVIIHDRDAHKDVYDILIEEKSAEVGGVLHSFSGDLDFLNSILNYNFYVSFTGSVTFKRSNYDTIVQNVPMEKLLLETDSPFLAPVPFRGKRNEPSYIRYNAEKIAKIKGVSLENLAEVTSENARQLFKLNS